MARINNLSGKDWLKFSISIWSDIHKSSEERRLDHPAIFPLELVERLIRCFTNEDAKVILDPFAGSGSSLIAARNCKKIGVGFETNPEYVDLANQRLSRPDLFSEIEYFPSFIYRMNAKDITNIITFNSVDFCVTSPPYWNILSQKRNADKKETRDYGNCINDLSQIFEYETFLISLSEVFKSVYKVLKHGSYMVVNVMDLRKGPNFYSFHSDLAEQLKRIGFTLEDIIIWNRSKDYNNLMPLGFNSSSFIVNKVHEYLLIFRKRNEN